MTQNEALAIMKTGVNVFLTGEPGSGKTHTVNNFVAWLREHGIEPAVTASTGIAATHIGGMTIHSWSGIGVKENLTRQDLGRIAANKRVARRVRNARVLIIDEISMLGAKTFAAVDAACRAICGNQAPFGGLSVILVGDFFQLPPIVRRIDRNSAEDMLIIPDEAEPQFAFQSPIWQMIDPFVCYLSEQHRQEDPAFLELLSAVRSGTVSDSHRTTLRARRITGKVSAETTQLFSHNIDVDRVNAIALARLPNETQTFLMESHGTENIKAGLKRGCLSPETLALKIGARVMFTKNDSGHRFVNGTLGVIAGFSSTGGHPIVKTFSGRTITAEPAEWIIEDNGRTLAKITQIPLRLAWAITVHKSQGMSLDAAHMDLSDAFEHGQGYVALSRVRTFAGLSLAGFNERALEVHPNIRAKDATFRAASCAAQEEFSNIPPPELSRRQNDFLRACGGMSRTTTKI